MSPTKYLPAAVLLTGLILAGCRAPGATQHDNIPAYVTGAAQYRFFESPQGLAQFLRYDSRCGPLVSAHRGGPVPAYPENALATFRRSIHAGSLIIEVDVRSTADGELVLLHDEQLDRTTSGEGLLNETAYETVRQLYLRDNEGIVTPFQIPTLAEALTWARGRAILSLDVKRGTDYQAVANSIRQTRTSGHVIVIVYSLLDLKSFMEHAPDLVYSIPMESMTDADDFETANGSYDQHIYWAGVGVPDPEIISHIHNMNGLVMAGTFGELDDAALTAGPEVYDRLLDMGVDVLATDNVSLASRVVATRVDDASCLYPK